MGLATRVGSDNVEKFFSFYLVHPKDGKIELSISWVAGRIVGLSILRDFIKLDVPYKVLGERSNQWLNDCSVAVYRKKPQGTITKPIELNDFTLNQVNPNFK